MICQLQGVSFTYPGSSRAALTEIDLSVEPGEHVAVVGPNGAGKSTLIRLIAGVLRPRTGRVLVFGRSPESWKRREIARRVGVVSQQVEATERITVRELVRMGRHPYVNPWAPLGVEDEEVVIRCLEAVDLADLADREAATLSGGELQRARLARALAQEPRLLLLDEPTAHLDLGHEARFMVLLQKYIVERSLTIVAITHHLSMAARYADRLVLLSGGNVLACGEATDVLTPSLLEQAFGWPIDVIDLGSLGLHAIPVVPRPGASGPR